MALLQKPIPEFSTIGEFYEYLDKKIQELAPETLPGKDSLQVTSPFFDDDVLFPLKKKTRHLTGDQYHYRTRRRNIDFTY